VERAGDDPKLFGAAGGGVNHFRMAAGKSVVFFIADQKNRKRAGGHGFDRGDFRHRKAGELFVAIEQRPGAGSEQSFAEPGIFSEAGVIIGSFAEIGEGRFGDDGFNARIEGRGLQHDSRAHGFAERKQVEGGPWNGRQIGIDAHLPNDVFVVLRIEKRVDDGACVVAFEPAVSGDGAAAGAVGAGVHHHDAVAGAKQEFGLADDSDAVVGDAMKNENPTPVRVFRADFPAAKYRSIGSLHLEILAGRAGDGKRSVSFADEIGREFAADGMEECRTSEPSGDSRQERGEEQ
jgi:hypothetical protein